MLDTGTAVELAELTAKSAFEHGDSEAKLTSCLMIFLRRRKRMIVNTEGPAGANIMIVGEAPGADEDATGKPIQGYAGRTLNTLLQQAGISRHACLDTNVARERPPGNNISLYFHDKQCTSPRPELQTWIDELKREIALHQPSVIIALGRTALWALTGETSISQFRGFLLPTTFTPRTKVLPTFHPQAVNYDWKLHFTVIMDLRKAARLAETRDFPVDNRRLRASPTYGEFMDYLEHLRSNQSTIAVDIETCQPGSHIHILGIADSPTSAYSFEILKGHKPIYTPHQEAMLWSAVTDVLNICPTIMHNGSYDAAVLMHLNGIYCRRFFFDTMIAAHVCWPETPRSLSYCSSICLDVPPWKHTSQSLPTLYNAADAANTFGIYEVLLNEIFKQNLNDVFSFEMAQIEPAIMLQLQGMYVDKAKQEEVKTKSSARIKELEDELFEILGKRVNYSSPKQLQTLLYIDLGLPVQYKRRKSANEERKITADAEALRKLNQKISNPILDKILELKKLIKLTTGFLNVETSPDSRVHTCYNVTGAS
jgi:DNA polymerase